MSVRIFTSVLIVTGFVSAVVQAADPIKLVVDKSKIGFVGKKSDGQHSGGFKKFTADAKADWEDASKSSLKMEIDTTSIWSDNEKLTEHLKNPDFFDVRKYPTIKFEATKIDHPDEGKATITGKLMMLEKTVEVTVPCKVDVTETSVKLTADFKIDRTKWGMVYGEGKVDKEVEISAELFFNR